MKLPQCLVLASINEEIKSAHAHSKTTFLRFSHKGGFMFDVKSEINLNRVIAERSKKIIEYNKR